MKRLEDLKEELLADKLQKFYVFYGEDYGIRKHYIHKIQTYFKNKAKYVDDYRKVMSNENTLSLFGSNEKLIVVYDDLEFAMQSKEQINKFIKGLSQYTCIFVYEQLSQTSTLMKEFSEYVTYFPVVQNNIAKEFVDSELKLNLTDSTTLAYNCGNNYNNILLESDKIHEYATSHNISQQSAYEVLYCKGQLLELFDVFNANDFMNDILTDNKTNYAYWYSIIKNDVDRFIYSLTFILNDYMISAILRNYGMWDGSSKAYNLGFSWGRIKVLRDLPINYKVDYLLECSYKVAELDEFLKRGKVDRNNVGDYFFSNVLSDYNLYVY